MNYRHPAGRLFCGVLSALAYWSLAGALSLAQETLVKDAPPLSLSSSNTFAAASGATPAGQEPPNLEPLPGEPQPVQTQPTQPDESPSVGNQPTVETNGQPPVGQTSIPTVIINGAGHTIGNWHIRPTLGTTVAWDDNIFISSVHRQAEFYTTISPGIAAGWGDFKQQLLGTAPYEHPFLWEPGDLQKRDYFYVQYTLSQNIFLRDASLNALNQGAALDTQFEFSKLTLRLRANALTLSDADIQLGTRVNRSVDNVDLSSTYALGEKTSLGIGFDENTNAYQGTTNFHGTALDATEVANQDWFSYTISPKIIGSIGTRISYLDAQQTPGQFAEQILLRAVCQPGGKFSLDAAVGVEFRQVTGGSGITDGVFRFAGTYQPFDGTMLTLRASRLTESSPELAGQDETATSVDAEIHQRLFQKFHVILTAGYSDNVYFNVLTVVTQRKDNYVYVRPSIMFDINRWGSLQLSFQFQDNQSTSTFGFIDHQAMLQCNIVF